MPAGEVRQRRGKKKSVARAAAAAASDEKKKEATTTSNEPPPEEEEETAWQTVKNHPLAMVLPIVLIPYTIYLSYLYFQLQRPDLLQKATLGLIQLRPAISVTDERQLLIVGTMSSGTVQVAHELSQKLGLEVGHEVSNADWSFVRDGTVSWFHGIRFLPPIELKEVVTKWSLLCGLTNYTENMGFHPNMYTSTKCSSRQKWSKCWSHACLSLLEQEWGCAYKDQGCTTPFHSSLLQVRNPMHVISSLVTKFCQGGLNGTMHSSFTTYAKALFPHTYMDNTAHYSCIEAASHYILEYNTALLKAHDAGLISQVYRIEETSPCDVARMAGLFDEKTTVYPPNFNKIDIICNNADNSAANQVMESTKHKVNLGQVSLTWKDLHGGMHGSTRPKGEKSLEKSIRALFQTLGYDPNSVAAAADSSDSENEQSSTR